VGGWDFGVGGGLALLAAASANVISKSTSRPSGGTWGDSDNAGGDGVCLRAFLGDGFEGELDVELEEELDMELSSREWLPAPVPTTGAAVDTASLSSGMVGKGSDTCGAESTSISPN